MNQKTWILHRAQDDNKSKTLDAGSRRHDEYVGESHMRKIAHTV